MTQICLVRHGQTDWNLAGRYMGQSDVPLNQNGHEQARRLIRQLQAHPFAAIYSSDLGRARETADIIAATLHLPVNCDARLREINQGEWEGQLVEDIQARYAKLWEQRSLDPASVRPPGGETVAEVAQRVGAALEDISRLHPGVDVLVISHGLAIATAICKVSAIPVGQAYGFIPDNVQPVWVEWGEG
jgi:alpha-ribazole phosphatase